jgi:hypothetical protein
MLTDTPQFLVSDFRDICTSYKLKEGTVLGCAYSTTESTFKIEAFRDGMYWISVSTRLAFSRLPSRLIFTTDSKGVMKKN